MYLNNFRNIQPYVRFRLVNIQRRCYEKPAIQRPQLSQERNIDANLDSVGVSPKEPIMTEMYPKQRVTPMGQNKDPIVLSFDDVPGPRAFKYVANFRQYISEVGTQLTVGMLTMALNLGSYFNTKRPLKNLSGLFDEYGPVVRFVSPVGGDIVLINHPEHIQKVYAMEGDYPVRSTLDSLEKYRARHRNIANGGLYSIHGEQWNRQRSLILAPLHQALKHQMVGINDVCESFTQKIYNIRNHQDEVSKDLYKLLHKWAFDSMGLVLFSKRFTMLETELVYSQCDMSWLYHSLEKATDAIIKCESGLHFWKLFSTPAWNSLVKYCESLDNLIGKQVIEAEHAISVGSKYDIPIDINVNTSLINALLTGEEKLTAEDIVTIIMDMLLIGVNTITSSMSFLLYYLAKYQRAQKILFKEIDKVSGSIDVTNMTKITELTPYLQACIKEALRLAPPIPVLTRILPKNITLDKYNIPRGTLIIMSTQDASLKEGNYDDAAVFNPERWLNEDSKEYPLFASMPFGFGARKCLGQNVSEIMMSLLTIRIIQKYKLEYHYGDIGSTRSFISKPNKALKIRFVDRV